MRANIRPELIEQAIEQHYATVEMPPVDVARGKAAIGALTDVSQATITKVKQAKTTLIAKLEARQDELVEMRFREKSISPALFKRKQAELQAELDAAQESLAETELRLTIDREQLELALELVEDVQAVYVAADQQIRRGYNQAFFEKVFALAESEEGQAETRVQIAGAELTEPYALLLTEGLFDQAEAEAIETGRSGNEALPAGPVRSTNKWRRDRDALQNDVWSASWLSCLIQRDGRRDDGQPRRFEMRARRHSPTAKRRTRTLGR
jgi:hypothetical protein